jgi:hypothetical protein
MPADFGRRFDELLKQADSVESSKRIAHTDYGEGTYVDSNILLNWQVKVRHLLSAVCGTESQHFKLLLKAEEPSMYTTNHENFQRMHAVLLAAKEDYDGGYLHSIRDLIQAAVFDSELEQAEELLTAGYDTAAAVIAGVVLEVRLRQLCEDRKIPIGTLDRMNADLAKADVYNKLTQKQITALADLRNRAAHGETGFTSSDVTSMVRDIRSLLADRLS